MRTSKNVMGIRNDRTKMSTARGRSVAAGVVLAILTMAACAPRPGSVSAGSTPAVSQWSDFGCEQ